MKSILFVLMLSLSINVSAQKKAVETFNKKVKNDIVFYAKNNTNATYSIKFNVEGFGFKVSAKSPIVAIVPPKGEIEITRITPQKNKKWKYKTNSSYIIGNVKAKHKSEFTYALPYNKGSAFTVNQGYNGSFSHTNKKAIDFTMPVGTPIHAVRSGKVMKVKKDSNSGCPTEKCIKQANYVWIEHIDGTIAKYVHLNYNGTHLKVGDSVEKGDKIGLSGNTGFSEGPHLHFEVMIPLINGKQKSISTKFNNGTNKAVILKKGDNFIKS